MASLYAPQVPLTAPAAIYGRRRTDLPTRGAVLNALRCQVERIELIRQTLPSVPSADQAAQLRRQALVLMEMVLDDAEPGLGERLRQALS